MNAVQHQYENPLVVAVDDDPITLSLVSQVLIRQGIPTQVAGSGDQMWALLARAVPKIVILDVEMPGDDGFTLAEQLRERFGLGVVIIMLTGRGKDGDIRTGLVVGADDYLVKPCDWRQLVALVRRYLGAQMPSPLPSPARPKCPSCGSALEATLPSAAGHVLACRHCGHSHFSDGR